MTKSKVKSGSIAAALMALGILIGGEGAFAFQGHMFAARADLQAARSQLNAAVPDKAGHRIAAMRLIDQAMEQTNAGIAAGAR